LSWLLKPLYSTGLSPTRPRPPKKVFDRHATLAGAQIINYRVTPDEKWLVLIGISGNTTNPSAFKVKGAMQLYSRDRGVSHATDGHATAFAEISQEGHPSSFRSLCGLRQVPRFVISLLVFSSHPDTRYLAPRSGNRPYHSSRKLLTSTSHLRLPTISQSPCKSPSSMALSTS